MIGTAARGTCNGARKRGGEHRARDACDERAPRRAARLPAADADLYEVLGPNVWDRGGVKVRRRVHPLVEVGLLDVGVPVEVNDPCRGRSAGCEGCGGASAARGVRGAPHRIPMRFDVTDASPRTVGKPIEWSPPRMTGKEPDAATCATAFEIWSNVFSMFAGIVKTSPASHLCGAGGCAA